MMAAAFVSCTNSDTYAFDEESSTFITVEAFVTTSFDGSTPNVKVDTIVPGDSLIFLTTISPSKSVRSQRIYWTLDGAFLAGEYSFRTAINTPGVHKVAFIFVDFFGDTLSDTLTLYASSAPILDAINFIPAAETQGIPTNETVKFAWNGVDPDNQWSLKYNFILRKSVENSDSSKTIIVDTLLDRTQFAFSGTLSDFTKYEWEVSAVNILNTPSAESISGSFFTSGTSGEGAILGTIRTNSEEIPNIVQATVLDDSGAVYKKFEDIELSPITRSFYLKGIPEGSYKLSINTPKQPDFASRTFSVKIKDNQVLQLDSIPLVDFNAPIIRSISGKDTLENQDTLKFLIEDGGGNIPLNRISAKIDGVSLHNISLSNDTLAVPMEQGKFWSYRILSITVLDLGKNRGFKAFYLKPNTDLGEVIK